MLNTVPGSLGALGKCLLNLISMQRTERWWSGQMRALGGTEDPNYSFSMQGFVHLLSAFGYKDACLFRYFQLCNFKEASQGKTLSTLFTTSRWYQRSHGHSAFGCVDKWTLGQFRKSLGFKIFPEPKLLMSLWSFCNMHTQSCLSPLMSWLF